MADPHRHPQPPWSKRSAAGRAIVLAALFGLAAPAAAGAAGAPQAGSLDPALYAALLESHTVATEDTVGTRVDYRGLSRSEDWRTLLGQLERARPDSIEDPNERLAFWINAYNILAIQKVIDHYPVESIRDIGNLLFPVWKQSAGTVGGETVTLHQIEHEILRKLDEPRIHAAIVCASTSCPSLARTPFTTEGLDAELAASTRRWIASDTKGLSIDRETGRVRVSKIFDWFEEDFGGERGVLKFVIRHAPRDEAAWLRARPEPPIDYFDYDWTLNDWQRTTGGGARPLPPGPLPRRVAKARGGL